MCVWEGGLRFPDGGAVAPLPPSGATPGTPTNKKHKKVYKLLWTGLKAVCLLDISLVVIGEDINLE